MEQIFRLADIHPVWEQQDSGLPLRPVYHLGHAQAGQNLNHHLGQGLVLHCEGAQVCSACQMEAERLFPGGHCYRCFTTLARCDPCVMSPSRCHYHAGTCREPNWADGFCMQPHVVYLAISSGPKVGITRRGREHSRWRDQGASQAMRLIDAPSRRAAGIIESRVAHMISDRTDWRRLVTGTGVKVDLGRLAAQLQAQLGELTGVCQQTEQAHMAVLDTAERQAIGWNVDGHITQLEHPVLKYSPAKRISMVAGETFRDNLLGILGRYLLFSRGVLHLDEYRGRTVTVELVPAFDDTQLPRERQASLF